MIEDKRKIVTQVLGSYYQNGDSIVEFLPDGVDEQSVLTLFKA